MFPEPSLHSQHPHLKQPFHLKPPLHRPLWELKVEDFHGKTKSIGDYKKDKKCFIITNVSVKGNLTDMNLRSLAELY